MKRLEWMAVCVLFLAASLPFHSQAQDDVTLTFTCRTTMGEFVQPDSITVMNLDRGWTETLYYPDTVYHLMIGDDVPVYTLGCSIAVSPNPFEGSTTLILTVGEPGDAVFEITDLTGRVVDRLYATSLLAGTHIIRVSLASPGAYLFSARIGEKIISQKMMNTRSGGRNAIEYGGLDETRLGTQLVGKSNIKANSSHAFQLGDKMSYVAHSLWHSSKAVVREQQGSEDFTLILPALCESTSQHPLQNGSAFHGNGYNGADDGLETAVNGRIVSVTDYDGNEYPVVRIGSQCWLAQNMRCTHSPRGHLMDGGNVLSNTGAFYYNYSSLTVPFEARGLFYNWAAAVDTTRADISPTFTNRRGICPLGWHVPSDAEWTTLTDYVSGQNEYWCGDTNINIAKALAVPDFWPGWGYGDDCDVGNAPENNNATGFSLFPAGIAGQCYDSDIAVISQVQQIAFLWTSTSQYGYYPYAYVRRLLNAAPYVEHFYTCKRIGISVRCLRD